MWRSGTSLQERYLRLFGAIMLALAIFLAPAGLASADSQTDRGRNPTYTNPLKPIVPGGGVVESCADPSIIYSRVPGDNNWYMYCTTDPLNDQDRTGTNFNFHPIPMLKSSDLINWRYIGDAFPSKPAYAAADAGLWAPDIEFLNGKYYLYYTVNNTNLPGGGSAIGVATSNSPAGPWVHSATPVIEPHAPPGGDPNARRWVFDPDVIEYNGSKYIYYGSYFGGISVRKLSADGLISDPATQQQIAIANKYEGATLYKHGNYWYLFLSATDCCRGPLTGYDVFVGRSANPLGPYVDQNGVSLLAGRTGGTPVITMNGNKWVGPGHNAVFQDFDGQDWTVYHAVNRFDPYFTGAVGFTKRPVLLDPLDWKDGWPVLRGGFGPSDGPVAAPAAQPRQDTRYNPRFAGDFKPSIQERSLSDEFNSNTLDSGQWSWVRPPATGTFGQNGGTFRFDTQAADLFEDSNNASVLTEPAPKVDFIVETRLKLSVPAEGCCFNYVQAGLVIYGDDNNFIKLAHVSIWETRQTEFGKEVSPGPAGFPRYGNTVVGPPGEWTYLRIVKRTGRTEEVYTPYTSRDGHNWEKGGAWTHKLGSNARIGLVSMGGSGFTANFDYVRVYRLQPRNSDEPNSTYDY